MAMTPQITHLRLYVVVMDTMSSADYVRSHTEACLAQLQLLSAFVDGIYLCNPHRRRYMLNAKMTTEDEHEPQGITVQRHGIQTVETLASIPHFHVANASTDPSFVLLVPSNVMVYADDLTAVRSYICAHTEPRQFFAAYRPPSTMSFSHWVHYTLLGYYMLFSMRRITTSAIAVPGALQLVRTHDGVPVDPSEVPVPTCGSRFSDAMSRLWQVIRICLFLWLLPFTCCRVANKPSDPIGKTGALQPFIGGAHQSLPKAVVLTLVDKKHGVGDRFSEALSRLVNHHMASPSIQMPIFLLLLSALDASLLLVPVPNTFVLSGAVVYVGICTILLRYLSVAMGGLARADMFWATVLHPIVAPLCMLYFLAVHLVRWYTQGEPISSAQAGMRLIMTLLVIVLVFYVGTMAR